MTDFYQLRTELEVKLETLEGVLNRLAKLAETRAYPSLYYLQNELAAHKIRLRGDLVFTVGIVGQIKAGKSTLADVLFFGGRDVLPTGPTPTTSALTQIDFRATKGDAAVIHYYTAEDWKRIEDIAEKWQREKRPFGSDDDVAAKGCAEMVERVRRARLDLTAYLGAHKEVPLGDLATDIGPTNPTAVLIHHIQLYTSERLLEGYRVVDTPGLNDTVFSREKITRDSLHGADCVLFLSRSNQFLDATDIDMLQTLQHMGVRNIEVLASMLDDVDGNPEPLLRDFGARLAREAGIAKSVLPVSPLLAKLSAKMARREPLSEDEEWSFGHYKLSPEELLRESHVEPLRAHLSRIVAENRLGTEKSIRSKCESLAEAVENYVKSRIHAAETILSNLEENQQEVRDELEKLKETKRALRLRVFQPEADQLLDLFQSSWKDFSDGISARINNAIDATTAIADSWGNKRDHRYAFEQHRGVLEQHLMSKSEAFRIDGQQGLTYVKLKERLAGSIAAVEKSLIVEAMEDALTSAFAQIFSDLFRSSVESAYNSGKRDEINEPAYQTISQTISEKVLKVNLKEREIILKAWRGMRSSWSATATPVKISDYQKCLRNFFDDTFEPAFEEQSRIAKMAPDERKEKTRELESELNELRDTLTIVQSAEG